MLDHRQSTGSDKFDDILASVWQGPDGAEMLDAAVALERGEVAMGAGRSDPMARHTGMDAKPMGPSTPYKEAAPRAAHGRLVGGPAGAAPGRPVITLPGNEEDGGLCWSPSNGGPHSPSMAVSPVPQRVQSPFANGPGGLLLGTSAGMAPAAEAGPSTGRMKAPAGSSGLPGVLNRALQAFPSGSGDASRRSSTSSYQHMTTAAAGGSGGMREYPSSARQMSCLGTGRYGSAMRGDGSGGLLGDTGDAQGATRPRRTTRRTVESRHKDSAIWSDAVDDKLAKQEKRMLKNRESAARSRLRRQQFTEGLERENANLKAEVFDLREKVAAMADQLDHVQQLLAAAKATGGMSGSTASAALAYFQSRYVMRDVPDGDEEAAAAEAEAEAEAMAAAAARGHGHGYIKTEPDVTQQEQRMHQEQQQQQQQQRPLQPSVTDAGRSFYPAAAPAAAAACGHDGMPGTQQQLKRPRDVPPAAAAAAAMAAMQSSSSLLNKGHSLPTTAPSLTLIDSDVGYGLLSDRKDSFECMLPPRGILGNSLGNSYDMDDLVGGPQGGLLGAHSTGLMTGWGAGAGRGYKRSRQSSS